MARTFGFVRSAALLTGALAALTISAFARPALAVNNEPPSCLSTDPSQWPAPAKPYFMLAVDTSSSMAQPTPVFGTPIVPSCAGYPATRNGHERCALLNTILAFSGQVNFGMAAFALNQSGCNGATPTCGTAATGAFQCFTNCSYSAVPNDVSQQTMGCGPVTAGDPTTRRGANLLVPMLQDHFWATPPAASNVPQLLQWVDNDTTGNTEIWATAQTPDNGMLRDLYRYFSGTYVNPASGSAVPTPLDPTNERACRSVNVILITAGDENCDTFPDAVNAATALYNGVTVGNFTWQIRTHVIAFVGGKNASVIAGVPTPPAPGQPPVLGTTAGHGYVANPTDSVQLSQALAKIIGSAIQPETCDNVDNNCNGCTDEGFKHSCNIQPTASNCCAWTTPAQRSTCLSNYQASITPANPKGTTTLLPCTDANQGSTPSTWLCYDPGDTCDNVDNNCDGHIDEGSVKCGSPLHCPQPEVCDGLDNDCNGIVDDKPDGTSVCPNNCHPTPEICDGCDNDCDGIVDNGVPTAACGLPSPANCVGTLSCVVGAASVPPGGCIAGGGHTTCSTSPQPEICDGIDNDCNGIVDDGVPSVPCGAVPGLDYGPKSQCKLGTTACVNGHTVCVGVIGPSPEVCDGVDNNCNGTVDEGVGNTGQPCGSSLGACKPGLTACVNGALTCVGGVGPTPEICDGIDNDCNGLVDDGSLTGAPANPGCWDLTGTCCSYTDPFTKKKTSWCAPPGGGCNDLGSLASPPCGAGTLTCAGAAGWVCTGAKDPHPETCDDIDNDCNGLVDDGPLPSPVGLPCGSNVGACTPGTNVCVNGQITCSGKGPTPETCDGIDNDCNGVIDDDIVGLGTPCTVPYDTTAYPGPRNKAPCHQGVLECDGMGNLVCVGGVGPSPEICDGIDNDCDGSIDEVGAAPDGINGTANPGVPPANIGDPCGGNSGTCMPGLWACSKGKFVCSGGLVAQPETCDCKDNDCDGVVDNASPNGPPLCSAGKDCVTASNGCFCAAPCESKEFPCPAGQNCVVVTIAGMPTETRYCVPDPCPACPMQKVVANGKTVCAPEGTPADPTTCATPPVCVCKGQNGCQDPCYGITCPDGTVCAETGPSAGKCVVDDCFNVPCTGCGRVCNHGQCQDDPCTPGRCKANEECKPSPDFSTYSCIKPCSAVTCPSGRTCVDGACVATCAPACGAGQTCDLSQSPPACLADKCSPNPCTDGSCCDPITGACGNCPCEGVICPEGAACANGQCTLVGGSTSSSSASSSSSSSGGTGGAEVPGIWGLATGGGGCACGVVPGAGALTDARWALLVVAIALGRRSARSRRSRAEVSR